jgi:hypothetical protein
MTRIVPKIAYRTNRAMLKWSEMTQEKYIAIDKEIKRYDVI